MATWPDTLPAPTLEGYALNRQDNLIRTDMESGAARVRRRSTATITRIPQRWLMDAQQFGLFEYWFDNGISQGAAWFLAPQKNALGVTPVECRFVQPYKAVPVSAVLWEVTAEIEARAMPRGQLVDWWPAGEPTLDLNFLTQTYGVAGL